MADRIESRREWLDRILADGRLTAHFARVAVALRQAIPLSDRGRVKVADLMTATNASEPTVRHAVERLRDLGYVTVEQSRCHFTVRIVHSLRARRAA